MSDMADVLVDHRLDTVLYLITDPEYLCICGKRSGSHEAHQADALSAAGFGPVREAWDEGYTTGNAHNGRRDANPYRQDT